MDENKMIRPMDFVRLTNIDELNVIKDTKNHIGLVKAVSRDGRWTQAAEELISSCGLTEDECRKLQEESESLWDVMETAP